MYSEAASVRDIVVSFLLGRQAQSHRLDLALVREGGFREISADRLKQKLLRPTAGGGGIAGICEICQIERPCPAPMPPASGGGRCSMMAELAIRGPIRFGSGRLSRGFVSTLSFVTVSWIVDQAARRRWHR
jgi:hypothetical protein